jgi:hypothetical protein
MKTITIPPVKYEIAKLETIQAEDVIKVKAWFGDRRDTGFSINLSKPIVPQIREALGNNGIAHLVHQAVLAYAEHHQLRVADLVKPIIPVKVKSLKAKV